MRCRLSAGRVSLELEGPERELLVVSLHEMRKHYALTWEELPEKMRHFWRGRLTGQEAQEEELTAAANELAEERLAWRGERLAWLERWLAEDGALHPAAAVPFVMTLEETDQFLRVLNDRRLTLAAEKNIGQAEMDLEPEEVKSLGLQRALWEIHFLSYVQHGCLDVLASQ